MKSYLITFIFSIVSVLYSPQMLLADLHSKRLNPKDTRPFFEQYRQPKGKKILSKKNKVTKTASLSSTSSCKKSNK